MHFGNAIIPSLFICLVSSYFQMRKKQKETDVSGDEKKDDDDASEQKKAPSPSRVDSSPQYFDSAAGPPGYCSRRLPSLRIVLL